MIGNLGRGVALALTACALTGGVARASQVEVDTVLSCEGDLACEKYAAGTPHNTLLFGDAPGEANDVTLRVTGPTTVLVHDEGAALTAGRQCTSAGPHDATCDLGSRPYETFGIDFRDGADRLHVEGLLPSDAVISGGPGDDDLTGGDEADLLLGGGGRDRLTGGGGADTLRGDDVTQPGETPQPDVIDGGAGEDLVDYWMRREDLTIDLSSSAPGQGAQGEGDTITGTESVLGGYGDDRLSGNDADGTLRGDTGDDVLDARGGDDTLIGGIGADTFRGGAGADRIDSNDGHGEPVSCGAGRDLVATERLYGEYETDLAWLGANSTDVLTSDCEGTALNGDTRRVPFTVDPRARRRGAIVTLANPCRSKRAGRRCSGRLQAAGTGKPGEIRFGRRGRRIGVRARGSLVKLRVRLNLRGQSYTTRFSVSLPRR
jgi:hypothetical protein